MILFSENIPFQHQTPPKKIKKTSLKTRALRDTKRSSRFGLGAPQIWQSMYLPDSRPDRQTVLPISAPGPQIVGVHCALRRAVQIAV